MISYMRLKNWKSATSAATPAPFCQRAQLVHRFGKFLTVLSSLAGIPSEVSSSFCLIGQLRTVHQHGLDLVDCVRVAQHAEFGVARFK